MERKVRWLPGMLQELESVVAFYEERIGARGHEALPEKTSALLMDRVAEAGEAFESYLPEIKDICKKALDEILLRVGKLVGPTYFDQHLCLLLERAKVSMSNPEPALVSELMHYVDQPYLIKSGKLLSDLFTTTARLKFVAGDASSAVQILSKGTTYFGNRYPRWCFRIAVAFPDLVGQVSEKRWLHWCGKLVKITTRIYSRSKITRGLRLVFVTALEYLVDRFSGMRTVSQYRRGIVDNRPKGRLWRSGQSKKAIDRVLITRAMGGIGDLLMMTPGLHALRQKWPRASIHFATLKAFFPLFEGNDDVELIDITAEPLDLASYSLWINLTDCPAARVESQTLPNVRENRIDIFARAMGIEGQQFISMDRRPRYFLSQSDRDLQAQFKASYNLGSKPVVGIHAASQESYKNYSAIRDVVYGLAKTCVVIVFHSEKLEGFAMENVIEVCGWRLRDAIALAALCNVIVGPDSAFVHVAAAFDIPCVALFGPTDGKVITKHYGNCRVLDSRKDLPCIPCWRNEYLPCRVSGTEVSVCMQTFSSSRIIEEVQKIMSHT